MNRIAQISVFIIIAVFLVGGVLITFFLTKKTNSFNGEFSSDAQVQAQFDEIRNSIADCMKFTSEDAVEMIGIQGGYYLAPKSNFDLGWAFIPYYYNSGKFSMPSDVEIEKQLGMYVDDNLKSCFDEFDYPSFKLDYFIKSLTHAKIDKQGVSFNIDMPISISKESKVFTLQLRDNDVKIESKLYSMLEVAKYVINSHKEDSEYICISCVDEMVKERGLYFDMLNFDDGASTLYVISQNTTEIPPIAFEFLNKYPVKMPTSLV